MAVFNKKRTFSRLSGFPPVPTNLRKVPTMVKTLKPLKIQQKRDLENSKSLERETALSASGACLARTEKLARASRRREQIPKESLRARSAL